MRLSFHTRAERPDLWDAGIPSADVWPEYNLHGEVLNELWGPLQDELPDFQFVLYDEDGEEVLAEGHTGPFAWSGDERELPDGIDRTLERVIEARRAGASVTALSALAAEVPRRNRSGGLAIEILRAMRTLAERHGLRHLVAPVRPSEKHRYPLAPIERYVTWRRDDGQLLDPWMRLHERLGARVSTPLPHSLLITGTVADWEEWTGMPFPESGDYVFPDGLAPVAIDVERDRGTYWEPNVWMVHPDV